MREMENFGALKKKVSNPSKANNQLLLLLLPLCDVKKVAALFVNVIIIMICNPTLFFIIIVVVVVVVVVVIDTVGIQLGELLHNFHALVFVFLLRLQLVLALVPLQTCVVE